MFLQEFEQSRHSPTRAKKARKEYSAGFRNFHPQKHPSQASLKTEAESDLFDQLKIGNLKELYLQSQPQINHTKELLQKQHESINRLITLPKKPSADQKEESEDGKHSKDDKKFMETYHKVPSFEETANATLFQSQFKKIDQKLREKFQSSKRVGTYEDSIKRFILAKHQKLNGKETSNDKLLLQYVNFLNQRRRDSDIDKKGIEASELSMVLEGNFYIYAKFKHPTSEDNVTFQTLSTLARSEKEINELKGDHFLVKVLNKRYTVPYEPEVNRELSKQSSIIDEIRRQPQPQAKEQKFTFHAAPIPPSTYQPPKQRPKSSMKAKTVQQPFNLTVASKEKTKKMDEYYNWDRTFHAKSVPKTTYEPQSISLADQAEKKRRAAELLQSAAFPSTMKYLDNYNEYAGAKQEKLKTKYTKNHQLDSKGHSIPNFQQIHYNQMLQLQARKAENRHQTIPQPFNFSEIKPRKQKESHQLIYQQQLFERKEGRPKEASRLQPQSTLKYEAYVGHLRKAKEQKEETQQERKKKEAKEEKKKKVYKEILKERIGQQLHNLPKNHISPQDLQANSVKVNLERIYNEQPLLIQREAAKSKKPAPTHRKDWQPII